MHYLTNMAKIKIDEFEARKLLQNNLGIPSFQRDSSWPANKVVKLWESISEFVARQESHLTNQYFYLGNLVTLNGNTEIVDGQQRINSMTIICCAFRDALIMTGHVKDAMNIQHDMIQHKSTFTLRYTLNPKYKSSVKAMNLITQPRVSFDTGWEITNVKSLGSSGKSELVELELTGKAKWFLNEKSKLSANNTDINFDKSASINDTEKGTIKRNARIKHGTNHSDIINQKLILGERKEQLTDHEICKAYKMVGGMFYHNLTDITCNSQFKTKKEIKNTKPQQIKFVMPGEWTTPSAIELGQILTVNQHGGGTYTLTQISKGKKFSSVYNVNVQYKAGLPLTLPAGSITIPRSTNYTTQDTRLTKVRQMIQRYHKVITKTKFSVTNFGTYANALLHFTIANDGTRMEPLFNLDLLHANTHGIIESLNSRGLITEKKSIENMWKQISDIILPADLDRKRSLAYSNMFLGRYCLSKDYRQGDGKRYQWKIKRGSKPDSAIFARLEEEVKNNASYFSSGTYLKGIVHFYAELQHHVNYHETSCNPERMIQPVGGTYPLIEPEAGALIVTVNKKLPEIFHPLVMMILHRHEHSSLSVRTAAIVDSYKIIIHYVARYMVHAHYVAKTKVDTMQIVPADLYSFYTREKGWCEVIPNPLTPLSDIPKEIEKAFKDWEAEKIKLKFHQPKWPVPASDRNHNVRTVDAGFLLHCYQYIKTHPKNFASRFLVQKAPNHSSHPEVEHILPQTEKTMESWWAKSWPNFKTKADWEANWEKLGNHCLLEDYINRGWGSEQKWEKKSDSGSKANSIPNSDYFKEQFHFKSLPKDWSPMDIENRSKDIWREICKNFP